MLYTTLGRIVAALAFFLLGRFLWGLAWGERSDQSGD